MEWTNHDPFECKGIRCLLHSEKRVSEKKREQSETIEGINRGFRIKDGVLYQYSQIRNGLMYMHIKRIVEEDGVHTLPLEL